MLRDELICLVEDFGRYVIELGMTLHHLSSLTSNVADSSTYRTTRYPSSFAFHLVNFLPEWKVRVWACSFCVLPIIMWV